MNSSFGHKNGSGFKSGYKMISYYADTEVPIICTIILIILICVGVTGNILSYFALKYSTHNSSSNFYLRCLAIADSFTLLAGTTGLLLNMIARPILGDSHPLIIYVAIQPILCKVRLFTTFYTRTVSVYIIVMFTIERCIIVHKPVYSQTHWVSVKQAGINVVVLVVMAVIINFPVFFSTYEKQYGNKPPVCRINHIFIAYTMYSLIALSFIPSVIIVACNSSIIVTLYRRGKEAMKNTTERGIKKRQQHRATRRLLAVSTAFVLLSTPLLILISMQVIGKAIREEKTSATTNQTASTYTTEQPDIFKSNHYANALLVALTLYSINFGINFALYCLTTRQFRLAVVALVTCDYQRLRELASYLAKNVQTPMSTPAASPNCSTAVTTASRVGDVSSRRATKETEQLALEILEREKNKQQPSQDSRHFKL